MSPAVLGFVCVVAIGSLLGGTCLGYWIARQHWLKSIDRVFELGREQGKKEALADAYRDPAPLPPVPPRKLSPLEEGFERMAHIIAATGIYMGNRD